MPTSTITGSSADTPTEPTVSETVDPATHSPQNTIDLSVPATQPAKDSLREQKKAKARDLILHCAQQLINTEGYTETKMRDVAEAANMSYQTLYNYFPTKGLILQELLTQDLSKLQRSTRETLKATQPLTNKLRELAKDYIDMVVPDERHLWKEVCAELLKSTARHSCFLALLDEQALNKFRELLSSSQANGELDPHIDSNTLADVLYSLLDAILMRYLVNESVSRPEILSAISAQIRLTVTPHIR